ncbi:MAG: TetR/AcrR family transcriptional regulator [Clostridiales bacterium]|nr:TetR/AcrR family transcriptional regulator [Clostridiales bacterium]
MDTRKTVIRMNKEDRRKQILDAAMKVFVDKGFKGSTTLEIAKKADISEVTLFRYFSSKKEMFLQGIEPILLSTLKENITTLNKLSAKEKLEYLLYERISVISKNYQVVKLILTETSLLSELGNGNFTNRIIEILKTMLTQIGVDINNKDFTIRLIMGSMLSFLYMPEKNEETIKNYVDKVVSLIIQENNK